MKETGKSFGRDSPPWLPEKFQKDFNQALKTGFVSKAEFLSFIGECDGRGSDQRIKELAVFFAEQRVTVVLNERLVPGLRQGSRYQLRPRVSTTRLRRNIPRRVKASLTRKERKNNLDLYFKELKKIPQLSKEDIVRLLHSYQNNENIDLRNQITEQNLRFVVKIANKYVERGLDKEDLIQEGNLGLITAVEQYDPEVGVSLAYHASFWIKHYMQRAIENQKYSVGRIPVYRQADIRVLLHAYRVLEGSLKREPTLEEIAEFLHWSLPRVQEVSRVYSTEKSAVHIDAPIAQMDRKATGGESILLCSKELNPELLAIAKDELYDLVKELDKFIEELGRMKVKPRDRSIF